MAFFILTRFVLVKYSRAFVERPLQGTSSLASRLTTVSLDILTGLLPRYRITKNYHSDPSLLAIFLPSGSRCHVRKIL